MCKNRDFALYGLWRPYKATKSYFFGIINVWSSSLGSRRNLHIGFIMGCRGGFSRKMQKTGGGGENRPPLMKLGLSDNCDMNTYRHTYIDIELVVAS